MERRVGFAKAVAVLYGRARISAADAQTAVPDLVLGILFVIALVKSRPR